MPTLDKPIRLQDYGVGVFGHIPTKSALKKAIKKQQVLVNGQIGSTADWISGGETISLSLPAAPQKQKLVFPLKVIYEDDQLAIIHKPAGIQVSGNGFKTIANALSQNLGVSNAPDATVPQPVHRLDYATTGVLLIGKTQSSIRDLNGLFREKSMTKIYYAITIGKMDKAGIIETPVDDKEARSIYRILESVASERFGKLNLVELKLETGRRHQLRVHLASIGNPILGDKDYGIDGLILNGKGLYLHAYSLSFTDPLSGIARHFTDELPNRFKKIFPSFLPLK